MSSSPVLEARDLRKYFHERKSVLDVIRRDNRNVVKAVDGVSLTVDSGESKGVIGESGCGKSTLLQTLVGLEEPNNGTILYKGTKIADLSKERKQKYRRNVQMIFQDPFNTLNPRMTVRESLKESLNIHNIETEVRPEKRIRTVLRDVELNPPENYIDERPNQLSGGELQRVSIARALIVEPEVLLADEPVSMLDVSTQASILNLLTKLRTEMDIGILYISHDLSTVSYVCDSTNVMYLGRMVESGDTMDLIQSPKHPYVQALINAIPIPDPNSDRQRTDIEGSPSDAINLTSGCRFRDRCPERMEICEQTPLTVVPEDENGHRVACHLYYEHDEHTTNVEGIYTHK